MDEKTSFTSEISRILRESRDFNTNQSDTKLRLAVAFGIKLHISMNIENKAEIGRVLGRAFAQDHRRMRFGTNNLIQARNSRSNWR